MGLKHLNFRFVSDFDIRNSSFWNVCGVKRITWPGYSELSAGFSEEVSVVGGVEAGVGIDSLEVDGTSITEAACSCLDSMAKVKDVSIKTMAAPTVTLLRNVPGPRLPKTV